MAYIMYKSYTSSSVYAINGINRKTILRFFPCSTLSINGYYIKYISKCFSNDAACVCDTIIVTHALYP